MKYILSILILAGLLVACNGTDSDAVPESLEEKKAYLQEKKAELNELTLLVSQLEASIAEEDPDFIAKKVSLVTTKPLQKSDFEHFVEIQGSVQADDMVDATSEAAGRIISLKVKEGDAVRRGQLIAELDMESLNKQIAELQTSLDLANTVYERQKRLWDQNIGSEIQYLQAKNNKERLEKSLETLQYQLTKAKVYAPISGVVEREVLQSGELASPGMPIVQILNTNDLKVKASVPETYLTAVRPGEAVRVQIPALDREVDARITQIGRTVDPANRTFEIEVDIPDPGRQLKPNLLAYVYIKDFEEEDVITVPLSQVQQEVGGQKYVLVVDRSEGEARARKVYVQTGRSNNEEVVITSGLTGDEELIMEGARGLADGVLIDITNTKTEVTNG